MKRLSIALAGAMTAGILLGLLGVPGPIAGVLGVLGGGIAVWLFDREKDEGNASRESEAWVEQPPVEIPRRRFRQQVSSSNAPSPNPPAVAGNEPKPDLLDGAIEEAIRDCPLDEVKDTYSRCLVASVYGAASAARWFQGKDDESARKWARSGEIEGRALLVVWGSTIAAWMMRAWPNQDRLLSQISRDLASLLQSDPDVDASELAAYARQRAADDLYSGEGVRMIADSLLVLRHHAALGIAAPRLATLPLPAKESLDLIRAGFVLPDPALSVSAALALNMGCEVTAGLLSRIWGVE